MVQQPDITITYFDVTGKAEPIRLALTIGGIAFKDERLQRDDWPALKPKTPFGQLPTMTINGETFAQSHALLRYAGRLSGLYPEDPIQALKVDMIGDQVEDIVQNLYPVFREEDPDKKKALIEEIVKSKLPGPCSALERNICKEKSGCSVGSSLTTADLLVYNLASLFKSGRFPGFPNDAFESYKNINRVHDTVCVNPKVVEWNNKHFKNA